MAWVHAGDRGRDLLTINAASENYHQAQQRLSWCTASTYVPSRAPQLLWSSGNSNLFPDPMLIPLLRHSHSIAPHIIYLLVTGYFIVPSFLVTSVILQRCPLFVFWTMSPCVFFSFIFGGVIFSFLHICSLPITFSLSYLRHSDGFSCYLSQQIKTPLVQIQVNVKHSTLDPSPEDKLL